jgi:hypothetical protein
MCSCSYGLLHVHYLLLECVLVPTVSCMCTIYCWNVFLFLRSLACALFTVGIPVQCEYKSGEGNVPAKFCENYHQSNGAASSLSHAATPSLRIFLHSTKKPYKNTPLNVRYAFLFYETFICSEVQTTIIHMLILKLNAGGNVYFR